MANSIYLPVLIVLLCVGNARYVQAADSGEWRDKVWQIATDSTQTDAARALAICDLTYHYYYYHQLLGQEEMAGLLTMALPLAGFPVNHDIACEIYAIALLLATEKKDIDEITRQCLLSAGQSGNPAARFKAWVRLGQKYIDHPVCLQYLRYAFEEARASGDYPAQAQAMRYTSIYYRYQQDYQRGLKYARESLAYARQSGNVRSQAHSWLELAYICYEIPDSLYWQEAADAYREVHRIYTQEILREETDSLTRYADYAHYMVALVNMSLFMGEIQEMQTATRYLHEALEIATSTGRTETAAFCYKQLGEICRQQSRYRQALDHYNRAGELLSGDYYRTEETDYLLYEIFFGKAGAYKMLGQYAQSAASYREGIGKYREVYNAEMAAGNRMLAAQYETARQEEELERMETVMAYRNRQWNYRISILILLVITLGFIYRLYHYKINLAVQREQRIRDEADRLRLERQKAELAARITTGEAGRLKQKLASASQLAEMHTRTLANLKAFFRSYPELSRYEKQFAVITHRQNRMEGSVQEFKSGIHDVLPEFNARMQQRAGGKLTALDLRYCRLLYLETSNRDMAGMLFVDPNTVKVTKYRLKQKFGLRKEDDLSHFIQQIADNN